MDIQTFLRLTIAKRIQQYMDENSLNNKEFIAEIERNEFNQTKYTMITEVELSKILNGRTISINALKSLKNLIYPNPDDIKPSANIDVSELVFGTDEDKLYLIRIILYNILGNSFLFYQDELRELQDRLKFRKSKEATFNYWLIDIPQTDQTTTVAKSLLWLLFEDSRFFKEYFARLYENTPILDTLNNLIQATLLDETIANLNHILIPPRNFKDDIDFFTTFLHAFDKFIITYREELLEYYHSNIFPLTKPIISEKDTKNPLFQFRDKFFIEQFTSEKFISFLQSSITEERKESLRIQSLYVLEKNIKSLHTSLHDSDFDYSILDDFD